MIPGAPHVADLTPKQKRLLLAQLLDQKGRSLKFETLSFSQERFWFFEQLDPGSIASILLGVRLSGHLNVAALEQSLNEMVRRHETLRTSFVTIGGQPKQAITAPQPMLMPVVDLESMPEDVQETEIRWLIKVEDYRRFDLTQGPLFRANLLRRSAEEYTLVLNTHHLISDGWSSNVLIGELAALYPAFATGQPSPLPDLPLQYSDYARQQRENLKGELLERQLAYWKEQLSNMPAALSLPTDRARLSIQTSRGAREPLMFPRALTEKLKTLAQQERGTLFMVLLAAFQVLLYRYTGQEDISVGTLVANRNMSEVEKLIGLLLNTLVLRTHLGGNPTFGELLRQVRQVTLGAYAHQAAPFEKLLEVLQPQRDLSRTPLFQVMLVLQNMPRPTIQLSDLTLRPLQLEREIHADVDLAPYLWETNNGLSGFVEYQTDLFDATTIRRMLRHFQALLESAVTNPNRRIADLPILAHAERRQILKEWNHTQAEFPDGRCVHELFEDQVELTPDAIAVVFEHQHLTYRELNRRANQLAHHLRQLGVGPEALVGLCLERSPEMIVGLLGILKAGGAYVPLDPAYPTRRLATILQDMQVRLLISQPALASVLPAIESPVLLIDRDWEVIAHADSCNPNRITEPSNLAYVIYTSGSTGKPKGVMLPHRALVQYVTAALRHFEVTPKDCVLQFASISFDAAAEEIYPCLIGGAKLVLRTDGMLDSIETFIHECAAQCITVLDLPTAYWHAMLAQFEAGSLDFAPALRLIILGGEAVLAERLATWQAQAPARIRLVNTYGPTETTIVATMCDLVKQPLSDDTLRVPIGKPVANTQVYVLDPHWQPVPIGVPGELHVGGTDLARGYLKRPDLTAAVFIPDPFSESAGGRLYKTGDLVRYLPDGNLEFIGRVDHQVKVRGYRIELGEIEAVLSRHPDVQAAVVVAREDEPGNKRLVAYVVATRQSTHNVGELQQLLQDNLPNYMAPSSFVWLEALPLTSSGKIDRRALPAPESDDKREEYAPPETPIEERLVEIWSQILKVDKPGIYDNFFDLGGHSLMATQVIYRINKAFQMNLSVRNIFEEPTIAGLALFIEEHLLGEITGQVG